MFSADLTREAAAGVAKAIFQLACVVASIAEVRPSVHTCIITTDRSWWVLVDSAGGVLSITRPTARSP
jgi:hypothetical protein